MKNYYQILGVTESSSQREIKNAYRDLVKRYHPDLNANSDEATKQTQLINEAYSTLSDPVKKYEYDNILRLQTQPESVEADRAESSQEVPHYHCEKCGRQDPTLRVTVFLWVVSFIYVTSKRGWGKILCSQCRVKYSILWNLVTWVAGWWGFPFGPICTIEALFKNSRGGILPAENNASLLAVLAYDFYLQGRYNDAFEALQESNRLQQTDEKAEFLNQLRQYVTPPEPKTFAETAFRYHPAFYNVPFLAILSLTSIIFFTSTDFPSISTSSSRYVPSVLNATRATSKISSDLFSVASALGIDLRQVEASGKTCNDAIAKVAAHIKSRVPYVGTTYQGRRAIRNYELDRSKLDHFVIQPQTELIFSEMRRTSNIITTVRRTIDTSIVGHSELLDAIDAQYRAMVASYFNCAILEYSIPIVNHYSAQGELEESYLSKVIALGKQSDVLAWLKKGPYRKYFQALVSTISKAQPTPQLKRLQSDIIRRKEQIDEDNSVLDSWLRRLEYYENADMYDEYNNLVDRYNYRLMTAKRRIQEYNDLVDRLNELLVSSADIDIDGAFNDCLNPQVLFADYEVVDFKSKRK